MKSVRWEPIRDLLIGAYLLLVTFLAYDYMSSLTINEYEWAIATMDRIATVMEVLR